MERNRQRIIPEPGLVKPASHETHPVNDSGVPERMLPSSDIDIKESKKKSVIENIEVLSPLKRGILWAEILGRPGGRHRRNT